MQHKLLCNFVTSGKFDLFFLSLKLAKCLCNFEVAIFLYFYRFRDISLKISWTLSWTPCFTRVWAVQKLAQIVPSHANMGAAILHIFWGHSLIDENLFSQPCNNSKQNGAFDYLDGSSISSAEVAHQPIYWKSILRKFHLIITTAMHA